MNVGKYGPAFVFAAFIATLIAYVVVTIAARGSIPLETLENILIGLGSALAALAIPRGSDSA